MDRTEPVIPSLRVVLVEDDPAAKIFLRDALETQLGHEVIGEANTGHEMVNIVLALQPDIVIFDIHLPGLNGLDALREIYQRQVVAGVAITADRDRKLLQKALDKHVLAYLVKPVEAHHLGPALLMAWVRFQQMQSLSTENEVLKQTLENRKVIERAKGALMNRNRWTEKEAFRRLQKGAMNSRLSMVELAQKVLNGVEIEF